MSARSERPVRILLVEDHALVRAGIRQILQAEPDLTVVAEAGDRAAAVEQARRTRPDVVLLDVQLPGGPAATTVANIQRVAPHARMLALSVHDEPGQVRDLLARGVAGYLLKSVDREDLLSAVRGVHKDPGRVVLLISRRSMNIVSQGSPMALSGRESEILSLVAAAKSNGQIARRLGLAEGTVKRHLRNIFDKLGAVSRIDAVNKAVESGLIGMETGDWQQDEPPLVS